MNENIIKELYKDYFWKHIHGQCNRPLPEHTFTFGYKAAEEKIKALQTRLADAEKVIGFYSNELNWKERPMDEDDWIFTYRTVVCSSDETMDRRGGKRAKEYQEKYGVKNG
jgi:hypothetical protein